VAFQMSATLRVLRIQTGLTLEELANLTDLTRSYLSKVERGLATPSITSALRIARALDVSIESLFDADPASDPVAIVRNPLTSEKPRTGVLELVAGAYSKWQMLAFVIHPDDTKSSTNLAGNHEGEEIVYVLSGKIEL